MLPVFKRQLNCTVRAEYELATSIGGVLVTEDTVVETDFAIPGRFAILAMIPAQSGAYPISKVGRIWYETPNFRICKILA